MSVPAVLCRPQVTDDGFTKAGCRSIRTNRTVPWTRKDASSAALRRELRRLGNSNTACSHEWFHSTPRTFAELASGGHDLPKLRKNQQGSHFGRARLQPCRKSLFWIYGAAVNRTPSRQNLTLPRRPAQIAPAQQMDVQMEHGLSRFRADIQHRAITFLDAALAPNLRRGQMA